MTPSDIASMSDDEAIAAATLLGADQLDWWKQSGRSEPERVRFSCFDEEDECPWQESSAPTPGEAARKYIARRLARNTI
jgi:hypothetical protein